MSAIISGSDGIGDVVRHNNDWRHLQPAYRAVIPHPSTPLPSDGNPPNWTAETFRISYKQCNAHVHPGKFWY